MSKDKPRTMNNAELCRRAHERLDQIFQEMENREEYGILGVEVVFERGQATQLRRTLHGTDRPAK